MNQRPERENRRTIFCTTEKALKAWESPRERNSNCDVPVTPVEQFYVPEEAPIVRITQNRPEGITIFSQETPFLCELFFGDSTGSPVIIPYGQYFSSVSYLDIPDIRDEQLYNIAKKDQTYINEQLSIENYAVINTLGLKSSQRNFLEEAVKQAVADLKIVVFEVGTRSLRCIFSSDEVTYGCPAETYLKGVPYNNTLYYPAGFRKSEISKANANDKVQQIAEAALATCLAGNDDVTVSCPDGFYSGPIAGDPNEINGISFIARDTFFEKTKQQANAKAIDAANAALTCLYCNEPFNVACPSGSITPSIDVPAGSICRETAEELQAAIEDFLASLEVCLFGNISTSCSCLDINGAYDDITNPGFSSNVAPNEFISESQKDADNQAKEYCFESLDCQYCSDPIYDPCEYPWYAYDQFKSFHKQWKALMNSPENAWTTLAYVSPTVEFEFQGQKFQIKGVSSSMRLKIENGMVYARREGAVVLRGPVRENYLPDPDSPEFKAKIKAVSQACEFKSPDSKLKATIEAAKAAFPTYGCVGQKTCPDGYSCLTEKEAAETMENPEIAPPEGATDGSSTCGVKLDENNEPVEMYCFKDAGGGPGPDGPDGPKTEPCEKDCECLTLQQAENKFGKDKVQQCFPKIAANGLPIPCKIDPPKSEKEIKDLTPDERIQTLYYCYKERKDDPPDPPASCPEGCECIANWDDANASAGDKYEYISCDSGGASPDTAACPWGTDYCYKLVPKECCADGYGTLTHIDCDGNSQLLLEWMNGVITTVGDQSFIAGCGSGDGTPPAGSEGDILYYDGSAWVSLSRPASGGLHVLGITPESMPYWVETEDCSLTPSP